MSISIISPINNHLYCLSSGDSIGVRAEFTSPQPDKVWYLPVSGSHFAAGFDDNPFQAGASEASQNGTEWTGSLSVGSTDVDAHVVFWWVEPDNCTIKMSHSDFHIGEPGGPGCGGGSGNVLAAATAARKKAAAKANGQAPANKKSKKRPAKKKS